MNLVNLRDDLLRQMGAEVTSGIPAVVLEDIASAINAAVQRMWDLGGEKYFLREELQVDLLSGENHIFLDDVQAIFPPFMDLTNVRPLITLPSKTDLDLYYHYHRPLPGVTSLPEAVHVDNQAAHDSPGTTPHWSITITPTPTVTTTIRAYCVRRLVSYTVAQLSESITLPIPHQHVETLVLPLARAALITSKYFGGNAEVVQKEAEAAIAKIVGNPQPPAP